MGDGAAAVVDDARAEAAAPVTRPRRRLRLPSWEVLGIIAFTAWIAWPFVAPGGYVIDFDTIAYSGPNLEATYRAWGHGHMPWWEPGAFGGTAFSANLQTAVFYPLKLLVWPLGAPAAIGVMTATHLFLLAFGMRHLARRTLHLDAPAGLVAAVVMVGAGSTMVRTVRFEQIAVMAWIPWLLVALDAVMVAPPGRRARAIAGGAVATALVLLSGHPHQAYLGAVLAAVWVLGRLLDHRGAPSDRPSSMIGRVGLAGLLGLGIAGVALVTALPALGGGAVPSSVLLEQATLDRYLLEPIRTAPMLFGDLVAPSGALSYPTAEAPAFLGVAAIALALVGAAVTLGTRRSSTPPVRATAAVLVVVGSGSLLLAFGPPAGVYRIAAAIVPGLGQGRVPLRWLFLTTFAVAVLAAAGASALRDHLLTRNRSVVASIGAGLAAMTVAALVPYAAGPGGVTRVAWLVGIGVVAGAVVVAIQREHERAARNILGVIAVAFVVLELGIPAANGYGRELRRDESFVTASSSAVSSFLAAHHDRYVTVGSSDANTSLTVGSRSLDGYDGGLWLTPAYVAGAQQLVDGPFKPLERISDQIHLPLDGEVLARLGVRYVVIDPHEHATRTLRRPPANPTEVEAARRQIVADWAGPVLVDGKREIWENPRFRGEAILRPDPSGPGATATAGRPEPGAIDVTTAADSPRGRLVVAEQAQPGWTARVDGAPTDLVVADGFALAVDLPPGAHQVELRYRPPGLTFGVVLSAVSIAVVIGLSLVGRRRRGAPPDAPPGV